MESGTLVAGRYRLERVIASGGMGSVWRAVDERLERDVAVKVLHPGLDESQRPRDRFEREAKTLASLKGPGCVEIYDFGEEADGDRAALFLVMELVEGVSLAELLHREERLDPARTMRIVAQVAEALAAAHRKGIVHRDVKPGNILVGEADRVKVVDFGISLFAHRARLTPTDAVLGTAPYVSPEQLRDKGVTGASDLYSLGAVAYECLTGAPPFDADDPAAIIHGHLYSDPPELPGDVPPEVAGVVTRSLKKVPEERWPSGEVLAAACRAATTGAHPQVATGEIAAAATEPFASAAAGPGAPQPGTSGVAGSDSPQAVAPQPGTDGAADGPGAGWAATPETGPGPNQAGDAAQPEAGQAVTPASGLSPHQTGAAALAQPGTGQAATPDSGLGPRHPGTGAHGPAAGSPGSAPSPADRDESATILLQRIPAAPPGAAPRKRRKRFALLALAVTTVAVVVAVLIARPWAGDGPVIGSGDPTTAPAAETASPTESAEPETSPVEEPEPTTAEATAETATENSGGHTEGHTGDSGEGGAEDDTAQDPPPTGDGTVPDVRGMTTFEARDALNAAGYTNVTATMGYWVISPEPQHCEVIVTSPSHGETVDYAENIDLSFHNRNSVGTSCAV
ncbi:protein kinase [Glycomyces sp. NPDC046736]|uniref:serine/threonine-protein kinase n=1 Tax=Glycomyces sp. NPDC046736 TaxID=3155615 RepID=UPI0033FAFB89